MLTVSSPVITASRRMVCTAMRRGSGSLHRKPKYTRSLVTTTRTSVSNGVGSPGFGDCCVSFNTGAERQMGSSNRPSSVMEPDERTAASMLGSSLPLALKPLVEASSNMKRQKYLGHLRAEGTWRGFRSWHMRSASVPPEDGAFGTTGKEAGRKEFSMFRR